MSIKIDKKVPMPTLRESAMKKWPFSKMEVGDSFLIKAEVEKRKVSSAASWYGKRTDTKFSIRLVPGTNDYRCWRIA